MDNDMQGEFVMGDASPSQDPASAGGGQRDRARPHRRESRRPESLAQQLIAPSLRDREATCGAGCSTEGEADACASAGCAAEPLVEQLANGFSYCDERHIVEVAFRGSRREFAEVVSDDLRLRVHDQVVVEGERGVEFGTVAMTGSLVHAKRKAKRLTADLLAHVVRRATPQDIEGHLRNLQSERPALDTCRQRVEHFGLPMNLVGAEWQFDRRRITFYFTAEGRVDFRELVRDLAAIFHTRIELRQIAIRDEARRLGGMGICGRELCCSTHLGRYEHITLDHARAQHLQINPTKLSGLCGRLKCCLLYELDAYVEALEHFPALESTLRTARGEAIVQKIDVFRDLIYLFHPESHEIETVTLTELAAMLGASGRGSSPPPERTRANAVHQ